MVHEPAWATVDVTHRSGERGASLVEAVVAAAVVTTIAAGVAHLMTWARQEAWSAGLQSAAVVSAVQKLEQLRSLAWYTDADGSTVSDETTSLAEDPPASTGTGLRPSPAGSLAQNTQGFVDYLDAQGRWCGTGVRPPPCAAYVRRWAVEPFDGDPEHARVLAVHVMPILEASRERGVRVVRLRTIRTRVAP